MLAMRGAVSRWAWRVAPSRGLRVALKQGQTQGMLACMPAQQGRRGFATFEGPGAKAARRQQPRNDKDGDGAGEGGKTVARVAEEEPKYVRIANRKAPLLQLGPEAELPSVVEAPRLDSVGAVVERLDALHPENWPPLLPSLPPLPAKKDMHPARRRRIRKRRDKLQLLTRHHPASMPPARRVNSYGDLLLAAYRQSGLFPPSRSRPGPGAAESKDSKGYFDDELEVDTAQEAARAERELRERQRKRTAADANPEAMQLMGYVLDQFQKFSEPSVSHYTLALTAFGRAHMLPEAEKVWRMLRRAYRRPDTTAWNCMLTAYHKCGKPAAVRKLFHEMERLKVRRDVHTYTILVDSLASTDLDTARQAFAEMDELGINKTPATYTVLMAAHAREGDLGGAFELLYDMINQDMRVDSVAWRTLALALCDAGQGEELDNLLDYMQKQDNVSLNNGTVVSMLRALGDSGQPEAALRLHQRLERGQLGTWCHPTKQSYISCLEALGGGSNVEDKQGKVQLPRGRVLAQGAEMYARAVDEGRFKARKGVVNLEQLPPAAAPFALHHVLTTLEAAGDDPAVLPSRGLVLIAGKREPLPEEPAAPQEEEGGEMLFVEEDPMEEPHVPLDWGEEESGEAVDTEEGMSEGWGSTAGEHSSELDGSDSSDSASMSEPDQAELGVWAKANLGLPASVSAAMLDGDWSDNLGEVWEGDEAIPLGSLPGPGVTPRASKAAEEGNNGHNAGEAAADTATRDRADLRHSVATCFLNSLTPSLWARERADNPGVLMLPRAKMLWWLKQRANQAEEERRRRQQRAQVKSGHRAPSKKEVGWERARQHFVADRLARLEGEEPEVDLLEGGSRLVAGDADAMQSDWGEWASGERLPMGRRALTQPIDPGLPAAGSLPEHRASRHWRPAEEPVQRRWKEMEQLPTARDVRAKAGGQQYVPLKALRGVQLERNEYMELQRMREAARLKAEELGIRPHRLEAHERWQQSLPEADSRPEPSRQRRADVEDKVQRLRAAERSGDRQAVLGDGGAAQVAPQQLDGGSGTGSALSAGTLAHLKQSGLLDDLDGPRESEFVDEE